MQIAFIGLGNMGAPMAINLVKAGHSVKAFDLSADAIAKVRVEGVDVAASARDAVQGAEVVISMLPARAHHSDDAVNTKSPAMKTVLGPSRSPSEPIAGEASSRMIVIGTVAAPAASAE